MPEIKVEVWPTDNHENRFSVKITFLNGKIWRSYYDKVAALKRDSRYILSNSRWYLIFISGKRLTGKLFLIIREKIANKDFRDSHKNEELHGYDVMAHYRKNVTRGGCEDFLANKN